MGPQQDIDRLSVLDEPIRRRLLDYVRASSEPVGREDAATAVGISRSLAAYHLDKLAEHGLLTTGYARPEGRSGPGAGRPAKLYSPAEAEPSAAAALHTVAARSGHELGEEARGSSLSAALADRGYEPFEDEDGVMRLRNCPFHRLAAEHRDLVCGMNQAYLEGFIEGLDRDDVTADLDPAPGRCCVTIRPRTKR
jgi:predicted ArsR family transcriptional regulator